MAKEVSRYLEGGERAERRLSPMKRSEHEKEQEAVNDASEGNCGRNESAGSTHHLERDVERRAQGGGYEIEDGATATACGAG